MSRVTIKLYRATQRKMDKDKLPFFSQISRILDPPFNLIGGRFWTDDNTSSYKK